MGVWLGLKRFKPYLLMVLFQFNFAGLYIISMVTLKQGMSHYVLPVYRHVIATLALAPFALIIERKIRPKLTLRIFLRIMLLGFIEPVLDQNVYYVGMKYTSATYAAAIANLIPAFTFIMALILRLEIVDMKKIHSLAKVFGTFLSVGGAMLMALYRGPIIDFIRSRANGSHYETAATSHSSSRDWIIGTLLLLWSSFGYSGFTILQSTTLKEYPAELSLTAFICLMGAVEGGAVALVMERHMDAWTIGWDSRLLAAAYSGLLSSGVGYYVQGVVCNLKGPVFVTSFYPLGMILTAVLGALIIAEQLFLGSVIGGILIVFGLYIFVWGKSKDPPISATLTTDEKSDNIHELKITDAETAMSKVSDYDYSMSSDAAVQSYIK